MNTKTSVADCLKFLEKLKNITASKKEKRQLEFAGKFIEKHSKENVICYKDYFVPVFFNADTKTLYGRAINKTNPYSFSLFIEGKSVKEFTDNFKDNVDMLERINISPVYA